MAGGSWQLLERGGELARIEQAIDALGRGHGGVLVIQGAAGIGKSTLLRRVCEYAAERGMQTLTARGNELERDFGFGVVRQLLEVRIVRAGEPERAELLAGAARLAGPVLGLGGSVGDSFAALHRLYWLVANLAIAGPVALAVDDLQWADEPSLRWLSYLSHRLEGLPVLVAVATRPPRSGHSPVLAELLAMDGAQILRPHPLSEPAVAQLLNQGLGVEPDPTFTTACARASGGNPFVLHELILDLTADGVAPVEEQAAGVAARVPDQVGRTVLARLGRLDHAAVRLAGAVAVLGDGAALRLAAALADLDIDVAAGAADALLTADLLAEIRPMRFVHPLVRSAVYDHKPARHARSPASPRKPRATARSPRRCSSPPRPSATTSPVPTANSTSPPATNLPRPWPPIRHPKRVSRFVRQRALTGEQSQAVALNLGELAADRSSSCASSVTGSAARPPSIASTACQAAASWVEPDQQILWQRVIEVVGNLEQSLANSICHSNSSDRATRQGRDAIRVIAP